MNQDFLALVKYISRHILLTPDEEIYFCSLLKLTYVKKKQFIVQPGFVANYRSYVLKGAMRAYLINSKGHSDGQTKNDENTLIVHDANTANQYYQSFAYLYLQAGGIITNPLSLNENAFASIWTIYPNPSNGIFHIENSSSTAPENTTLNIIDILGRTILTKTYNNSFPETIDLSNKTNGLYFIQLQNQSQSP